MSDADDRVKQLVNELMRVRVALGAATRDAATALKMFEDATEECSKLQKQLEEVGDVRGELLKSTNLVDALGAELEALVRADFQPQSPVAPEHSVEVLKDLREFMGDLIAKARECDAEDAKNEGVDDDIRYAPSAVAAVYRECAGRIQKLFRKHLEAGT